MTAKEDRSPVQGAPDMQLLALGLYPIDDDGFVKPEWRAFVAARRCYKFETAAANTPSWVTGDEPAPRVHDKRKHRPRFIKCGVAVPCDHMLKLPRSLEFGLKRMFPDRRGPPRRRGFSLQVQQADVWYPGKPPPMDGFGFLNELEENYEQEVERQPEVVSLSRPIGSVYSGVDQSRHEGDE